MNQKVYKVWKLLLNNPNEWLSVYWISSQLKLTFRQVISVISGINSEYIEKERTEGGVVVSLNVTDEQLTEIWRKVTREFYNIDETFIDTVRHALSSCGWLSITDIAADTGLKPIKISMALSTMDNVKHKCVDAKHLYLKEV
jgi:hypothetical protein